MQNDFLPFGTDPLANVITQADWVALAARTLGFQAGIANSAQLNKAWRQSSFIAAAIAQYVATTTGQDVLDDGDLAAFLTKLTNAITIGANIKPARLVLVSTALTILPTDYAVGLARTASPAPTAASLPAAAQVGQEFTIEDLSSNFNLYPVTFTPPAGDTIAGKPDFTANQARQCVMFRKYNNNLWSVDA